MAECDWIILCDYAFPAMHAKLCMIGIFDTVFTPSVPTMHPRAMIGFSLIGEPGESGTMKLEVIGPTGKIISTADAQFTLPDAGSAFGHLEIQNLLLEELGRYAIQINLGEGLPKQAWLTLKPIPA